MTREEAINLLDLQLHGTPKQIEQHGSYEHATAIRMAIKALEQEPILGKIRAEIDETRFIDKDTRHCKNALASGLEVAMKIIDKYKAESEEENED